MRLQKQLKKIFKLNNQSTNTVLMIRPVVFAKNDQTNISNHFQKSINLSPRIIQEKALQEFDIFVSKLTDVGVRVLVIEDTLTPHTPDSIFSNNWISFHNGGLVGVYPMEASNRRKERREDVIDLVESKLGLEVKDVIDYTSAEDEGVFLEGTGSIVLDRVHKFAYCVSSSRSDENLFIEFCEDFDYDPVYFSANQSIEGKLKPIYHTNVMLSIASDFAVVCLDVIYDKKEKKNVLNHLKKSNKDIIVISETQMNAFAGNVLELELEGKKNILVMSDQAKQSFTKEQLFKLEKYITIIDVNIETIETVSGGSARCMLTEVF
jgi:hypothetical protein